MSSAVNLTRAPRAGQGACDATGWSAPIEKRSIGDVWQMERDGDGERGSARAQRSAFMSSGKFEENE